MQYTEDGAEWLTLHPPATCGRTSLRAAVVPAAPDRYQVNIVSGSSRTMCLRQRMSDQPPSTTRSSYMWGEVSTRNNIAGSSSARVGLSRRRFLNFCGKRSERREPPAHAPFPYLVGGRLFTPRRVSQRNLPVTELGFERGRPLGNDAVLFRPDEDLMSCCENLPGRGLRSWDQGFGRRHPMATV